MRHIRTTLTFTCDGCDQPSANYADTAVVVKSPGALVFVITCPLCGVANGSQSLDECTIARSAGTPLVSLPAGRTVGAQQAGALSEVEVEQFAARLACTPDGRVRRRSDFAFGFALRALWAELAEVTS